VGFEQSRQLLAHQDPGLIGEHVLFGAEGERNVGIRGLQNGFVFQSYSPVKADNLGGWGIGFGVVAQTKLHHLGGSVVDGGGDVDDDMAAAIGVADVKVVGEGQMPG